MKRLRIWGSRGPGLNGDSSRIQLGVRYDRYSLKTGYIVTVIHVSRSVLRAARTQLLRRSRSLLLLLSTPGILRMYQIS